MLKSTLLILTFAMLISAGARRNWQTGKVTSATVTRISACALFQIDSGTMLYDATECSMKRQPANLTVNGRVTFAVEKIKLFVIDDDGKEHEMAIERKTLK